MSSGPARGSSSSSAGESLRNSCNDFARTLARLPASIMEGLSRSIPRRRSHPPVPHRLQPPPQAPPLLPPLFVPEELLFFSVFEQQYGAHHPFFYGCRFADALRAARREGKLVFVYLHDPGHPYTEPFCRRTLCSDVVVEFLDANFVSWGAVSGSGEGPGMVASLQPGSFPFCAVVAPVSDESIAVLQQVEGPVSPSELVEILQRTIDEQGAAFRASRPDEQSAAIRSARTAEEEERRRSALRLRQEQDAAYLESLRRDQEKERSRKSLQEGAAKPRAGNQLRPRHPGQAARQPTKPTQIKASPQKETAASPRTEPDTKIMIRFPNGERRQQSFRHTDTIRDVYRYVDSLGIPGIGSYQLVRSYPRKTYGQQQLGMTLGDAGFYPSVALYIEQLS
ncbi:plant UBX domain-containing protein 10-like [Panicum miliaceum]|uniref:Plant UBX domain-containing protein 10-like n=1 Tax=Panicum miliaceum TaxID=4540 RepID=A0A3L6TD55_PANMI|nr:plant UBX domain-containing protein 10-like [Panicum miliaceum]